jgi:hypothetical protein
MMEGLESMAVLRVNLFALRTTTIFSLKDSTLTTEPAL